MQDVTERAVLASPAFCHVGDRRESAGDDPETVRQDKEHGHAERQIRAHTRRAPARLAMREQERRDGHALQEDRVLRFSPIPRAAPVAIHQRSRPFVRARYRKSAVSAKNGSTTRLWLNSSVIHV